MASRIIHIFLTTFLVMYCSTSWGESYDAARHRLPPVMYSLNIQNTVYNNWDTSISWSLMGYHETYDVIITVTDENDKTIFKENVSPYKTENGQYSWGDVRSQRFHYKTTMKLIFDKSQDLTVRLYASPPYDQIDTSFLSLIIPGGHDYRYADSTGRKILINGIASDFDNVTEFFRIMDTVCGPDIAQFSAHFREPTAAYKKWTVSFSTPNGTYIDFITPLPTSNFDKAYALGDQLVSAVPGLGTLWSAANIVGTAFFSGEYESISTFEYSGGELDVDDWLDMHYHKSQRDRKLNFRIRGDLPDNYWYIKVSVTYETTNNEYKIENVRVPLECFGGVSDSTL